MANHSSIFAWRISGTEVPGRLQSTGPQSDTTERTSIHICICVYVYICIHMYICVYIVYICICIYSASLVAQTVKNLPVVQETGI